MTEARTSPYLGLHAYTEEDAPFFFGREREGGIIIDNLLAYRLTLLYGESGVGKSSILGAGVVHGLRRIAEDNRERASGSELAIVVCSEWIEPLASLTARVAAARAEPTATRSLYEAVQALGREVGGDVLILLDQFEDYFLYHARAEEDDGFVAALSSLVDAPDLRANVVISIREDALARLDRFKVAIPGLFENYLRLEPLGREAARAAIERPIARFNEQPGVEQVAIESTLVDAVLDELEAGDVGVSAPGAGGGVERHTARDGVETPYLQLVMRRLWDAEITEQSRTLRCETLTRLGGARRIVRTHVDAIIRAFTEPERDVVAAIFHDLVTPSGTKVAHSIPDLAQMSELSAERVRPVVAKLCDANARILRPVPAAGPASPERFELFHDVLAPAVLEWRARRVQEQRERRQAETRRLAELEHRKDVRNRWVRRLAVVLLIAVLVAAVLAVIALRQRDHAVAEGSAARSAEFAARSLSELESDPATGAALAHAALRRKPGSGEARDALVQAASQLFVRRVLRGNASGLDAESVQTPLTPDGRRLLTVSDNGEARLWDPNAGRSEHVLRHGREPVVFAALSGTGRQAVTIGASGIARIWDVATGRETLALRTPKETTGVGLSPDGTRLVSTDETPRATLWDVRSGRAIRRLDAPGPIVAAAFDDSGDRVIAASVLGAVVFSARSGRATFLPHETALSIGYPYAFDRSGRTVVDASPTGAVNLHDIASGLRRAVLQAAGPIERAAFSRDGRLVAGVFRNRARVWNVRGRLVSTLTGHQNSVNSAAFSPDGRLVVTASDDQTARIWETATGDEVRELRGHVDRVTGAFFTPDGRSVVTEGSDGTARVWDAGTGTVLRSHSDWAVRTAFSPDGRLLATGGADGTLNVWDVGEARRVQRFRPGGFVDAVAFTPDGKQVLAANSDGVVRLWDVRTGVATHRFRAPQRHDIYAAAISPNGRVLATSQGQPPVVQLWDIAHDKRMGALKATGFVLDASFSRDGRLLAAASLDGTVRIWDTAAHVVRTVLRGQGGGVYGFSFSRDGRLGVTAGGDRTATVWELRGGRRVSVLRGHTARVNTAVFTADGDGVVTAGDTTVRVWDARTGHQTAILRRHGNVVNDVDVRADGLIASVSDDRTARLYRCQTCGTTAQLDDQVTKILRRVLPRDEQRRYGIAP